MDNPTRKQIRAELARRMGYYPKESANGFYWLILGDDLVSRRGWRDEAGCWDDAPDPLTDAADNRALVAWICVNDYKSAFGDELLKAIGIRDRFLGDKFPAEFHIADILNAPLETITLAAAKALGIETE